MARKTEKNKALVSIIMGSKSDWPTLAVAAETLDEFGVANELGALVESVNADGLELRRREGIFILG